MSSVCEVCGKDHRPPSPEVIAEILASWAKDWGIDVARLTYVDERGGEIWVDGKPEIFDMVHP